MLGHGIITTSIIYSWHEHTGLHYHFENGGKFSSCLISQWAVTGSGNHTYPGVSLADFRARVVSFLTYYLKTVSAIR